MTTHLHLVGSKPHPKKPPLKFTSEQREKLAVALSNLRRLYGTWAALADAMGVAKGTLKRVRSGRTGSMAVAVRAAEVAGIPVERLLSGAITSTTTCPHCGQSMPQEVQS